MKDVFEYLDNHSDWQDYSPGLDRVKAALKELGHPEQSFKAVAVGGTNGKGTVTYNISDSLGENTGLFQSPHLNNVRERITQGGKWFDDTHWRDACVEIGSKAGTDFSYFEWLFLLGCVMFRNRRCPWVVFEVGMGGRLDAVNALEPDISVLTNVGLDHTRYLGEDCDSIAVEKLAIGRRGRPFLLPDQLKTYPKSMSKLKSLGAREIWIPVSSEYEDNHRYIEVFRELLGLPHHKLINPPGRREVVEDRIFIDTAHNAMAWNDLKKWLENRGCADYRVLFRLTGGRKPSDLVDIFKDRAKAFFTMRHFLSGEGEEREYLLAGVQIIDKLEGLLHEPLLICGNHALIGWVRSELQLN